jgi:multidrug resistance efflux pump
VRLIVAATGRAVSNLDVDIKCKASGTVLKLPFDISQPVNKGELLVELDPVDEQRAVKLAQAALDASQAKLAQSRQNLTVAELTLKTDKSKADAAIVAAKARADRARIKADRLKKTMDQEFTSREDYETAETDAVEAAANLDTARVRLEELKTQEAALELRRQDIKLSEADVESDRVNLANSQQRLIDTRVLAPMDAVVSARNVQTGQIISSGVTNVGGGTTVLTLSDLARMFVLASVDESDIGKVALDQDVNLTADAFPNMKFKGKVQRIATKGVNVSNVVTFEVKVEVVSRNKNKLKPEMTTNLEIVAAEKEDALLAPSDSIARKQGKRLVNLVVGEGKTEERAVEVGINDGSKAEILSGLQQGDVVEVRKAASESKWRADQPRPTMNPFGGGARR